MKYKVLFAKTGIAKFMALLVTLAMFASCNFVGGEDARTPTAGSKDPGKFGGIFKSAISGLGLQIDEDGKSFSVDKEGYLVLKSYWGGRYGSYDEKGAAPTGKYDVSNVAYVQFDIKSYSEGSFGIVVFGDDANEGTVEFKREKDSEEEIMVKKNNWITIENKREYSEILFSVAGDMEVGSRVKIENVTFRDESGKEVVPKYIKYAEVERPEGPDNPDVGNKEGAFKGFFSGDIQGNLNVEIWANGETFAFDAPTINVLAPQGWWGGRIYLREEKEFDVSEIVSVSFDIVSDKGGKLYVNIYQKAYEKTKKDMDYAVFNLELKADEKKTVDIGPFESVDKSNTLVAFGGDGSLKGANVKITNLKYLDKYGNEVVPKVIE